ncbi:MAG TPA: hypothetical protein VLS90_13605 [Thermodesulfobacteriota bacterium]|nr:hypothetical protein [Thermodesulfobacteriota bacterium]
MRKFIFVALIAVLGLSGCTNNSISKAIREDWTEFWDEPKAETGKMIEKEAGEPDGREW